MSHIRTEAVDTTQTPQTQRLFKLKTGAVKPWKAPRFGSRCIQRWLNPVKSISFLCALEKSARSVLGNAKWCKWTSKRCRFTDLQKNVTSNQNVWNVQSEELQEVPKWMAYWNPPPLQGIGICINCSNQDYGGSRNSGPCLHICSGPKNNCMHKPHLPWPEGVWKKNCKKHVSKLLLNVVSKPESVNIVLQRSTAKETSWMNCHIDTAQ